MKKTFIIITILALLVGSVIAYEYVGGKCSGTDSCSACKNCKYCKNCAKNGGTCGVCK